MKHKVVKISAIVVSAIALCLIVLALSVSSIVKNYIEKHSKEMIGRQILMSKLHLNIFTGTLEMDSLRMYEANSTKVFASIDTFYMELTIHKLLGSTFELSQIKVIRPYVDIIQKKDSFNFNDLLYKYEHRDTTPSSFPKAIILKNIFIKGGKIVYTDLQLHNTIKMNDLGVAIPEMRFGEGDTHAGIHLKIGENATVDSHLALNMKTNQYILGLQISNLPLSIFYPYAKEELNIAQLEGFINTNLNITGDMDHMMNFVVTGTASGKSFNITNKAGEELASAATAEVKIDSLLWNSSAYLLDYVHASGVHLNFIMRKTTTNYTNLLTPAAEDTTSPSQPMTVKIKDLHITNSQLTYTDQTLSVPFTLPVQQIDFQVANYDMNGTNTYKMQARFPEGGLMHFSWKGNMNNLANQDIMLNMRNISLRLFSPYVVQYTAYPITTGNFNFVSKNVIRRNNLNSSNLLDAFNANVGKKQHGVKPEYHIPMKLALYILKDKDGKIEFNVPVQGNIHDPKFSYTKIILKTLVNLMVKVAISPVRFLAGSLGLNPDKMEAIVMQPLQTDFTAQQYQQLNDLANMLKQKPDMLLTLTQYVDLKDMLPAYALFKTKSAYLKSQQKDSTQQQIHYSDIELVNNNDAGFVAYVDTLVKAKSNLPVNASIQDKVNALYAPDSIQAGAQRFLQRRNLFILHYMTTSYQVPEKSLIVRTVGQDTLNTYSSKAKYAIKMTLPGADNSVDTTNVK
ncbi:DUF748 domain-containing protein [Microbacter margulisiae]|uniref:DUF748 domain-containing protein n=1 Tax=Microbacter margulisiae TaxID=1350067 RepID=A0A7W5DQB2_9PORP|nr:DUF748 domain-containing protein [Microbacter margulisiae]MBB3186358.1 hypothetical protein [Microbacter margulisiae]